MSLDNTARPRHKTAQHFFHMAAHIAPHAFIEALESRIAPAVVISPGGKVAHYTDLDGDRVTITVSKGRLTASDFIMSGEGATVPGGEKLVVLDFSDDLGEFHRANLTIIASPTRLGGDGAADVGFINAADGLTDFGRVKIDGVLERIVAGDANDGPRSPGVRLLIAHDFWGSSNEVVGGIAKIVQAGEPQTNAGPENVQRVGSFAVNGGAVNLGLGVVTQATTPVLPAPDNFGATVSAGLIKTGAGISSQGTSSVFTGSLAGTSGGTVNLGLSAFTLRLPSTEASTAASISGTGYGSVVVRGTVSNLSSVSYGGSSSLGGVISGGAALQIIAAVDSDRAETLSANDTFAIAPSSNTLGFVKTGVGALVLSGATSNIVT